jgi:predicted nucleic-acid-binding protein
MTGLDTNVLVRYFTLDDPSQSRRAEAFLDALTPNAKGFVSQVCLIELAWVLRSQYRLSKPRLIHCMERLLNSPELVVENHDAVTKALNRFSQLKADFADCLIERSGASAGCADTVTFDVDASKFAGMRLL